MLAFGGAGGGGGASATGGGCGLGISASRPERSISPLHSFHRTTRPAPAMKTRRTHWAMSAGKVCMVPPLRFLVANDFAAQKDCVARGEHGEKVRKPLYRPRLQCLRNNGDQSADGHKEELHPLGREAAVVGCKKAVQGNLPSDEAVRDQHRDREQPCLQEPPQCGTGCHCYPASAHR